MKVVRTYGIGLLFILIALFISFNDVQCANPDDYISILNASLSINNTFAYGEHFYVVNDTEVLKYWLEDGALVNTYVITDFMDTIHEVLEKGGEAYIDFTRAGSRYIMCFDLATFTELNRTLKTNIDSVMVNDDVWNWLYWEIDDIGYWFYSYSYRGASAMQHTHANNVKGNFDEISPFTGYGVYSFGHTASSTYLGNVFHNVTMFNTSDSSETIFSRNFATADRRSVFTYITVFWNGTHFELGGAFDDEQVFNGGGIELESNNAIGGRDDCYNIQSIFDENGNSYATFGMHTIRGKLAGEAIPETAVSNNKVEYFWDCEEKVFSHNDWWGGTVGTGFYQATNTIAGGFVGGWSVFNINNEPRMRSQELTRKIGSVAFGYYETYTGFDNYYIGYVNQSNLVPISERIVLAVGNDIVSSFDYTDVEECYIYESELNLVATFTRISDTTLYILRNLIDRGELASGGYTTPTLRFIDATLYTIIGDQKIVNDGWLFMGEIYQLESNIQNMTTYYLEIDDGENTVRFFYNNETKSLNITESEQFLTGLIYSEVQTVNATEEKYFCIWRFILNRNIVDNQNLIVTYWGINTIEGKTVSGTAISGLKIYNLGGITYYDFQGDGGRTSTGTAFELYATNGSEGSYAKAEQVFRKLQSVQFLMELDMSNEWDAGNGEFDIDAGVGYVDIGIDYRLGGSWITGYKVRLYVYSADVGHHNAGNDHNWIEWSVDFHNYDPVTKLQQNLQSQYIYSNHYGYANENLSPDYFNRTSTQFWIDLWFDRTNASTTVGTQVNSYYHGMKEHGSAWWFGYGVFQPMISNYDNAKFLDDLYDEDGEISNCQKIELVKFWVKLAKVDIVDGNDETWLIRSIENMHREQATDRMEGIDEPIFVSTKVLDMPQTGFINAIKSAINGLSTAIWKGALQFVKLLMASIGYLMNAIGLGEWWEAVSRTIDYIATASLNFMESFETALLNAVILLNQIFRLVSSGFTRFTSVMTNTISSLLNWYTYIIQLFTGGGIFNINIWIGLNIEDFVMLGIHLLPLLWVNRLAKADDLVRTIQGDLSFAIMLVTGLFNFLVTIIMLSVALLNFLIGLLPI